MANTQNEQDKTELLAAFIENRMTSEDRVRFEHLYTTDSEFREAVEQANYMAMLNDTMSEEAVPEWNKDTTFPINERVSWWQGNGLSFASFACSFFAVFMVISGLNIQMEEGRISLGFSQVLSEKQMQEQVQQIVQERLHEYQQANQQLLAQYLDSLQQQQMATNKQFTDYMLASSRQERREDFAELIEFVNQQRYDDQVFFARQLNELQQELNSQAGFNLDAVRPISDLNLDE